MHIKMSVIVEQKDEISNHNNNDQIDDRLI